MKRRPIAFVVLLFAATSCFGGGAQTRTVLVDYQHDEFASFFFANLPQKVTIAAGDTLVFKQTWTGEPHTVTGGTFVSKKINKGIAWIDFFEGFDGMRARGVDLPDPNAEPRGSLAELLRTAERSKVEPERTRFLKGYDAVVAGGSKLPPRNNPGKTTFAETLPIVQKESDKAFEGLPFSFNDGGKIVQNAGQACYLDKGLPPKNEDEPCSKSQQRQPVFDGKASFYSSGIIPYQGTQGNTFKVKFSPATAPGSYFFYCAVHGLSQTSRIVVKRPGESIPSQTDVSREARTEIAQIAKPLLSLFRDARDGRVRIEGRTVRGPFAGLGLPEVHGSVNEFLPKTIRTKVGRPVTWTIIGTDHTITFDVPKYFPIIRFAKNGNISLNPKLDTPAGGSPKIPEQEGMGVRKLDGGTYDGTGYFSSGSFGAEPYAEYTLRFSKTGRYKYACLIHPPMVGTVVVT